MSRSVLAWHFAPASMRCAHDGRRIRVGQTLTVKGPPILCERGLHASARVLDALRAALVTDERSWTAIRVARAYQAGRATEQELAAARDAARAARDAAWDAARDAARAARDAARDARDAAWAAARDAARAAARAAAGAAARAAAGDAAWAAQSTLLARLATAAHRRARR